MAGETMLSWLATYVLHSTLLMGAAWLATRGGPLATSTARDAVWKIASTGALLTATLQLVLPARGFAVEWEAVPAIDAGASQTVEPVVPGGGATPTATGGPVGTGLEPAPPDLRTGSSSTVRPPLGSLPPEAATTLLPEHGEPRTVSWPTSLLAGWLAIAAAFLSRHAYRHRRFNRRLGSRREVIQGPPRETLDGLLRQAGLDRRVRLTTTSTVTSPVALVGNEICIPQRALEDLDSRALRALLAHELAHLERRDPLWIEIVAGLESLLFFQPLHRVGRHELRSAAEEECDAWAARLTGERHALARCLIEVAGWMRGVRAAEAVGMAEPGKGLERRVERLIRPTPEAARASWRAGALAALGLVVAIACGGPAVRPAEDGPSPVEAAAEPRPVRPPSVVVARPAVPAGGAIEPPPAVEAIPPDTLETSERVREYVWRGDDGDPWLALEWSPGALRAQLERLEETLERSLEPLEDFEFLEFHFDPAPGRALAAVFPGDRLRVRMEGEVEWGEGTVASVSPDGWVEIDDLRDEPSRRLVVTPGEDGELLFDYRVDGRPHAFDEAGRSWLRGVVERIQNADDSGGRRIRIGRAFAPKALADIRVLRRDLDRGRADAERAVGLEEAGRHRAAALRARLQALEREMERLRQEIDRLETEPDP